MAFELAQIAAGLPMAASLAAAAGWNGLRAGRRRAALNEALHELRRPLQALALGLPSERSSDPALGGSIQMAAAALQRLEDEINGRSGSFAPESFDPRPLVEAAALRWCEAARLGGGGICLRWRAGDGALCGNESRLGQALDNLLANSIEHGGPSIVVEVGRCGDRLRLSVRDRSRAARPKTTSRSPKAWWAPVSRPGGPGRRSRPGLLTRLGGRRRRGHGLRVVRRVAAEHGGEFALRRSAAGTEAVLDLPLAAAPGDDGSA